MGFDNVHEVSFGGPSPDYHDANWRAYMWRQMKDWLAKGAIPDEEQLALQIYLPGYHINRSNKLVLESKSDLAQRGEASPDDADALALTFAQHVAPIEPPKQGPCCTTYSVTASRAWAAAAGCDDAAMLRRRGTPSPTRCLPSCTTLSDARSRTRVSTQRPG